MGCDIHFFVEKKVNGVWVDQDPRPPADWDNPKFDYSAWKKAKPPFIYNGRNYDLFAILANVRNGVGFAGIPTSRRFEPISQPRGVPKGREKPDAPFLKHSKDYGIDGHSHSWLLVSELLDYDWYQVGELFGVVNAGEYISFKEKGRPSSWSGDVWGQDVKHVSNTEMEDAIKRNDTRGLYTRISWKRPYRECVGGFYTETLPALKALCSSPGFDDVRCVFFFDN